MNITNIYLKNLIYKNKSKKTKKVYIKLPYRKAKRNRMLLLILGGLLVGIIAFMAVQSLSPYIGSSSTPTNASTFKLISYVDGEDVSNFVEISIWTPDSDAEFNDVEDIYRMSNFEEKETSVDAEDVSIDLSAYTYAWIEIDPDAETVFESNWFLLYGGVNYAYTFKVYHQTSDVNFNMLAATTLDEITVGAYSTDADLLILMDCPHNTTTDLHYGSNWAISTEDYTEMSASELEELRDEKNYRCQAPIYDPSDDNEKEADDPLEKLTNAFAIRLTFNGSISTVDNAVTQVNCTVDDSDESIEVVISGTYIYLIFYEIIDFEAGSYDFIIEMEFGNQIHLDNAHTGRISVPRGDDNLGAFTVYSAIGA